ncbi:hypothetical protein ACIRQP_21530 [Streptomyces sp. NPDC102274]|uniref:hypothetical protein n=1 Tax=Streptomyces sp. NPDC102274 TaxID=3366151 RepID=UPI00382AF818
MHRYRAGLLVGSAALLLTSCVGPSAGGSSAGSSAGPQLPVVTSLPRLALPFDTYKWTPSELWRYERARRLLAQDCLEDRGIGVVLPEKEAPPAAPYDNSRRYGVVDPEASAQYGYHVPDMWSSQARRLRAEAIEWGQLLRPEEERALYGDADQQGCYGVADAVLERTAPGTESSWLTVQSVQSLRRTENTAEVNRARGAWTACMKQKGFRYDHPDRAIGDRVWDLDAPTISAREIDTATADVRCKHSSGLLTTWHEAERTLQRQVIARHTKTFARLAADKRAQLATINRLLTDRR